MTQNNEHLVVVTLAFVIILVALSIVFFTGTSSLP